MNTSTTCWFCGRPDEKLCKCGRRFCSAHSFQDRCLVCALGRGKYENADVPEPVSDLLVLSLSAAAGDPYIVIPPRVQGSTPLPMWGVERLLGAIVLMLRAGDVPVRRRAASVLAATTNSWPTLNPSQLSQRKYGTSLLATVQVREPLLQALKESRTLSTEAIAIVILDKLITADFRDLYPRIAAGLQSFNPSSLGTMVHDVFSAFDDFYPTMSYAVNERCELFVYEHLMNRKLGTADMMERMYGPRLRYAPALAKMLKKGVWHSSYELFSDWYPGEDEPG